ncbi:MAG: hypothetical protein ACK8QZ_10375, partial [Anaerolineales bacterium]
MGGKLQGEASCIGAARKNSDAEALGANLHQDKILGAAFAANFDNQGVQDLDKLLCLMLWRQNCIEELQDSDRGGEEYDGKKHQRENPTTSILESGYEDDKYGQPVYRNGTAYLRVEAKFQGHPFLKVEEPERPLQLDKGTGN